MAVPGASDNYHFDIHASVVFQLGQDLITDEVQALVELVKNAYDADATYAKVTVDTKGTPGKNSAFPDAPGYIRIEDNGTGMTPESVRRGWLTISNSLKRALKNQGKTTNRGRTPLGDKGLGRLGAQRLGYNVEIFTRPADSPVEYHVSYSWRQFESEELLNQVEVEFEELPPQREQGTTLIISDLKDPSVWVGDDAIARFRTDLSRMISPYEKVQGFTLGVIINGSRLDLVEFTKQVRQTAQVHYDINFDGTDFSITGRARLSFFQPDKSPQDQDRFRRLVESDGGDRLFSFLSNHREGKQYGLAHSTEAGWYVEFCRKRPLADLDSLTVMEEDGRLQIANPGPFHAEVDAFDLGRGSVSEQNVFNIGKEYREYIKNISGIRVYRDGFAIRVEADWLNIGGGWNSAPSWYGLKGKSTIGFIALSAKDNACLEETTNRESFKVTPYYRNFYEMLRQFLRFTDMAQEFLRRSYNDFQKAELTEAAQVKTSTSTEELSRRISQGVSRAEAQLGLLEKVRETFDLTIHDAQETLARAETQPSLFGDQQHVHTAVNSLSQRLGEARSTLAGVEAFVKEMSDLKAVGELLDQRLAALRDQLAQVYEMVSLGITAEALSHEISNVGDRLAYRTQEVSQHLREQNNRDAQLVSYIEYVYTSLAALQKQISHLAPSMQYVREKRELIPLRDFFADTRDYFNSRFSGSSITVQVEPASSDFAIRMNRGKLSQVVDNLLINSQYWLEEEKRIGRSEVGLISVELDEPFVRIRDSGRGVDPSVESTLFEAFVTTKGRGQGRGLGLFIVRQLLDSEGCTISLLPDRNAAGRLHVFEINFTGALTGDE